MRKLFVSFTALLRAVAVGRVNQKDLEAGLFYFGCTLEHAINPGAAGEGSEVEWIVRDCGKERAKQVHKQIVAAVQRAKENGRMRFRVRGESSSFEVLNELLVANGYAALPLRLERSHDGGHYSYPGVENRVQASGLELEVIR